MPTLAGREQCDRWAQVLPRNGQTQSCRHSTDQTGPVTRRTQHRKGAEGQEPRQPDRLVCMCHSRTAEWSVVAPTSPRCSHHQRELTTGQGQSPRLTRSFSGNATLTTQAIGQRRAHLGGQERGAQDSPAWPSGERDSARWSKALQSDGKATNHTGLFKHSLNRRHSASLTWATFRALDAVCSQPAAPDGAGARPTAPRGAWNQRAARMPRRRARGCPLDTGQLHISRRSPLTQTGYVVGHRELNGQARPPSPAAAVHEEVRAGAQGAQLMAPSDPHLGAGRGGVPGGQLRQTGWFPQGPHHSRASLGSRAPRPDHQVATEARRGGPCTRWPDGGRSTEG